jgi:hypothetical protein
MNLHQTAYIPSPLEARGRLEASKKSSRSCYGSRARFALDFVGLDAALVDLAAAYPYFQLGFEGATTRGAFSVCAKNES